MTAPAEDGPPRISGARTWRALGRCLTLLEPKERRRWTLLIPLALAAAGLEAAGAVLIFTLIRFISAPESLADSRWLLAAQSLLGHPEHGDFLIIFSAAVGAFYFIKNGALIFQTYFTARSAGASVDSLSNRLLRGYLFAPYAHHLTRNSAELIRNTNEAVVAAYRNVLMAVVHAASEASLLLALISVLVFAAPGITLLAVGAVAALILIFLRVSQRHMVGWGYEAHTLHASMLSHLNQSLGGVKEVKVLGRERFFIDSFAALRHRLTEITWRRTTLENAPRLTMETFFVLAVVLVILVFEQRGSTREVVPVLGLFAYTGFRILPGLHRIVSYVNVIRFGASAIDEIFDDAQTFSHLGKDVGADRPEPMAFQREITISNLGFSYTADRGPALNDINLRVQRGQSVGIVGVTGAGKSTFVDLLLGLLDADAGAVQVDGVDIQSNLRGWRTNVGYVPQNIYLVDDTLRRNIALGIVDGEIDPQRLQAAAEMAQLDGLLKKLPEGLQTVVGERGVRLSGGERQRVAIARALYHQPEVLIFDEATSSLDNKTEREITTAIESFRGEKTVVVIAHRLSTVKNCDQILFLGQGKVLGSGTFDELVSDNPAFKELASQS